MRALTTTGIAPILLSANPSALTTKRDSRGGSNAVSNRPDASVFTHRGTCVASVSTVTEALIGGRPAGSHTNPAIAPLPEVCPGAEIVWIKITPRIESACLESLSTILPPSMEYDAVLEYERLECGFVSDMSSHCDQGIL